MLSLILSGKPYRPLGAPASRDNLSNVTKEFGLIQVRADSS